MKNFGRICTALQRNISFLSIPQQKRPPVLAESRSSACECARLHPRVNDEQRKQFWTAPHWSWGNRPEVGQTISHWCKQAADVIYFGATAFVASTSVVGKVKKSKIRWKFPPRAPVGKSFLPRTFFVFFAKFFFVSNFGINFLHLMPSFWDSAHCKICTVRF